ncbi:MAG TPA: hypothetical protein VFJ94_04375 [Intrasporangium sp.]|nr:hypothetical protein [Intrasporangium sp.]HET7397741.1 hypothetical protein [Intrasporangium sp.]
MRELRGITDDDLPRAGQRSATVLMGASVTARRRLGQPAFVAAGVGNAT